jgi:hypothetical protein
MASENVPQGPVRVEPSTVARWLTADVTSCELEAHAALARGDETGALGMLARAGGLADAYALITGACRTCGAHVGQPHRNITCRSGGMVVGGREDVPATYCTDVAPARTGTWEEVVGGTGL